MSQDQPIDDGSGKVTVWRIEDFEKVLISDEDQIGHFYDGDSYVVLYTYLVPPDDIEQHIIYFWQGRYSTIDERGASAIYSVELDNSYGGKPVQVRVPQGREPGHFRSIFSGGMVVHKGGVASGFRNRDDKDSFDTDGLRFYHVKGTTPLNTYGVYVEEKATSLNSSDCFILVNGDQVTQWIGSCCTESEQEVATKLASNFSPDFVTILEGEEPDEFWEALGGKEDYPKLRPEEPQPTDPRLFECSDALGEFTVSEIENFTQEDLNDDAVMVMDCGTAVFVWFGSKSNPDEQTKSMGSARQYLETSPDDRGGHNVNIIRVFAGSEPPLFTQYFLGWDPNLRTKENVYIDPYEEKKRKMQEEEEAAEAAEEEGATDPLSLDSSKSSSFDPTSREATLSDEEFESTFGMTKTEFYELPKWRQIEQKKEVGLF